jgi:fructose-1,6-bisphosphatase I
MFQGGIFLYPSTRRHPQGKLRLLYECNPMSFIVEQAGGKAISCDMNRIMEIEATALHQKSSIAIGSPDMVDEMQAFIQKYSAQRG